MSSVDIYNTNKEKVSQVELDEKIFDCEVNPHLLYETVKEHLAKRRSGTASTKNRSSVRGGGKKPWRQKGTGRARAGTIRSPLWTGGGVVFGPSPRDYSYRINKKVRKSALRSALSSKLKENNLILVDTIHLPEIKTKTFISLLERLDIQDALIVDDGNTNLEKSAQNVPLFKVVRPEGLNVYDILKREKLVITQASLEKITRNLSA
jgi:large subunit ribosomal protein L4